MRRAKCQLRKLLINSAMKSFRSPHSDFRIDVPYFFFELFSLAVLPELVKIAVSSFDSLCNDLVRSLFSVSDSIINSSQSVVSSASSSTTVTFEIKSAFERALHADL